MELELENPITSFNDEDSNTLASLFLAESDHMPSGQFFKMLKARDFDISVRREAISSIFQISCNFDPFLSYLAVNYLDRFLSSQGIPQPRSWALKLLSIACVSLAAKMRKVELSFTYIQEQGIEGFVFDSRTIQRMEFLVLGALKWRMRSITPFAFISYFISLFNLEDPPLMQALKARSIDIIFRVQHDIKLLEFKPSIVAVSTLISASHELFPSKCTSFRKAILACSYVNKESMLQCHNAMQEIAIDGYESGFDAASGSDTPVNVLDFSSSGSERTNGITTTASSSSALRTERDIKRRKINGHYNNNNQTVQISQVKHC